MPWSVTVSSMSSPARRTATRTSPAVRAELDGVVDEVDHDLAEASLVAAHGGNARLGLGHERHAAALREQAEAFGRGDGEARQVHVIPEAQLGAALHPGEVQHLVDHLGDVARLHLDQRDALAHPGRDVGDLGLAGEGLGKQRDGGQRRAQLVPQVVDELRADLLETAQLGDVLEDQDEVVRGQAMGADDERARLRGAGAVLHGRGAADGHRVERRLDAHVQERLHDAPARQAPGDAEQGVGPLVRGGDPVIVADVQDADRQQVERGIRGRAAGSGAAVVATAPGRSHRRQRRSLHDPVQLVGPAADHEQRGPQRDGQADGGDPEQGFHAAEDRTAGGQRARRTSGPAEPSPAAPAPPPVAAVQGATSAA